MEQTSNLQLLPQGRFIIKDKDGQNRTGRFSMYVLDRFCVKYGDLSYLALLEKITFGMTIKEYGTLILMAFEDYFRNNLDNSPYTLESVMDLIDFQLDGIASDDFRSLIEHAIGRVANMKKVMADALAIAEQDKTLTDAQKEEKKSE